MLWAEVPEDESDPDGDRTSQAEVPRPSSPRAGPGLDCTCLGVNLEPRAVMLKVGVMSFGGSRSMRVVPWQRHRLLGQTRRRRSPCRCISAASKACVGVSDWQNPS
jgi:hypothetical protein